MSDAIGAEAAQIAGPASLLSSVVDRDMCRQGYVAKRRKSGYDVFRALAEGERNGL